MQKLIKTFALIGILSVTVWLGSSREAHAYPACSTLEGSYPCFEEGMTMLCETYSKPASKICTCDWGIWKNPRPPAPACRGARDLSMLQKTMNVLQLHGNMQQFLVNMLQIADILLQISGSAPPPLLPRDARRLRMLQITVILQHPLRSGGARRARFAASTEFLLQIKSSRHPRKLELLHISW
jgi:hypothetical protein